MNKTIHRRIRSVVPLIMHSGRLANPLDYFAKEIKKISGKKKKTDSDFEQMAKLEFFGSLYVNKEGHPIVPVEVIEGALVTAARRVRRGNDAKAGIYVASDAILEYDGPKEREALWADERFRLVSGVRVGKARVMRTRPRFDQWEADVAVTFDDSILNESEVVDLLVRAGEEAGIGDWRPRFGRFGIVSQ